MLDVASRRILGFALSGHHDAQLAYGALAMAAAVRGGQIAGVILHTDQGSEYTAGTFRRACARMKIRQSMGRPGSALDKGLDSYCTSWGCSDARAGRRGCAHWIWAGSGPASSMTATGSSQCGQFPPIPTARPNVPQSWQRCWPSARLEQLSHS